MASIITSTIGTTGRDYSTMQAWETAKAGDLVSADQVQKGECYADSDFTAFVWIDGSTTDSTRYMWLTVAVGERHNGTSTGGGVAVAYNNGASDKVRIYDDYSVVEWIRFTGNANSGVSQIRFGATGCTVQNNVIHDSTNGYGIRVSASGSSTVQNNIIYDIATQYGIYMNSGGAQYAYNNTVYNCTTGLYHNSGAGNLIKNNICIGNGTDFNFATAPTNDYNISTDASATGANSLTGKTAVNNFVSTTGGSEDLHLKAGADAIGVGVGPSADANVPTDDIDGDTRSGATTDIGADEFVLVPYSFQCSWETGTGIANSSPTAPEGTLDVALFFTKQTTSVFPLGGVNSVNSTNQSGIMQVDISGTVMYTRFFFRYNGGMSPGETIGLSECGKFSPPGPNSQVLLTDAGGGTVTLTGQADKTTAYGSVSISAGVIYQLETYIERNTLNGASFKVWNEAGTSQVGTTQIYGGTTANDGNIDVFLMQYTGTGVATDVDYDALALDNSTWVGPATGGGSIGGWISSTYDED